MERRQLARTLLLVAAIRAALWTVPFRILHTRLIQRPCPLPQIPRPRASVDAIHRAVKHVRICARFIPRATCLTQAIAVKLLLQDAGLASTVRIGVARPAAGQPFRAHAWLECKGAVVIGGELMTDFTPLPPMKTGRGPMI